MRWAKTLQCLWLLISVASAHELGQKHALAGYNSSDTAILVTARPEPQDAQDEPETQPAAKPAAPAKGGCTATSYDKVASTLKTCPGRHITLSNIKVPAGGQITLSGLKSKTITIAGTLEFTPSKGRGPDKVLIMMSNCNDVHLKGAEGNKIECHGEFYWDTLGGNGGQPKPKFLRVEKSNDIVLDGLRVFNTPVHSFAISGSKGVMIKNILLNNEAGNKPCSGGKLSMRDVNAAKSCGHNTDGFGISRSSGVTIRDSRIFNQDDCLAVNSGSNIKFINNYCDGGHGISIGSIKSGQTVDGVTVSNCTISRNENGVRIKTYDDAKEASVSGITYSDIILKGITKYGIVVQQDYRNGGPTGKAGSNVPIKKIKFSNIKGSMGGNKHNKVYVLCGAGTCKDWEWKDIKITGEGSPLKSPPCKNAEASVQKSAVCSGGSG